MAHRLLLRKVVKPCIRMRILQAAQCERCIPFNQVSFDRFCSSNDPVMKTMNNQIGNKIIKTYADLDADMKARHKEVFASSEHEIDRKLSMLMDWNIEFYDTDILMRLLYPKIKVVDLESRLKKLAGVFTVIPIPPKNLLTVRRVNRVMKYKDMLTEFQDWISIKQLKNIYSLQDLESILLKPEHLKFLREIGFDFEEIVNHKTLFTGNYTVTNLRLSYEKLHSEDISPITLGLLMKFSRINQVTPDSLRHRAHTDYYLKVCNPEHLETMLKVTASETNQLRDASEIDIKTNYIFLKSCGFDDEHIWRTPIILGNDPRQLQYRWENLREKDEDTWNSNKHRLINLLQYRIEYPG